VDRGFSGAGGGFGIPGAVPLDVKTSYNGVLADSAAFNRKVKLVWLGLGTAKPQRMHDGIIAFHKALETAGINHVYYDSPTSRRERRTSGRRGAGHSASLLRCCSEWAREKLGVGVRLLLRSKPRCVIQKKDSDPTGKGV
jgi:hypothetical protein